MKPFQEHEFTISIMPVLLADAYAGNQHALIAYLLKTRAQVFFQGSGFRAFAQPVGKGDVKAIFVKDVGIAPLGQKFFLARTEPFWISARDFLFGRNRPEQVEKRHYLRSKRIDTLYGLLFLWGLLGWNKREERAEPREIEPGQRDGLPVFNKAVGEKQQFAFRQTLFQKKRSFQRSVQPVTSCVGCERMESFSCESWKNGLGHCMTRFTLPAK